MATAAGLRAGAVRMRELACTVTDPKAEIDLVVVVAELERLAWLMDNGALCLSGAAGP